MKSFSYPHSLATVLVALLLHLAALPAQSQVVFDATNFPDAAFRNYLMSRYRSNGFTAEGVTITAEQLNSITSIYLYYNSNLQSLKGIEHFKNLITLEAYSNGLTTIDLSQNTELTKIDLNGNKLTSLDVSNNTKLTNLDIAKNQITGALDFTPNTALKELKMYSNKITAVNVRSCTELVAFNCYSNQLTSLDVSQNANLIRLECGYNRLGAINLRSNPLLEYLECNNAELTELDITQNPKLKILFCANNNKDKITIPHNYLRSLDVSDKPDLVHLDLIGNTNMNDLKLNAHKLKRLDFSCAADANLDLSQQDELVELIINSAQLSSIDLTGLTNLKHLKAQYTPIENLNISACTLLENISLSSNPNLKSIDLSANVNLKSFSTYNCKLRELDLSNNTKLEGLQCPGNELVGLDLSNNSRLTSNYDVNPLIYTLSLSNGVTGSTYYSHYSTSFDYSNQRRPIEAMTSYTVVKENGQDVIKNFYYLRLDDNTTGDEFSLEDHLAEGNPSGQKTFLVSNLNAWKGGYSGVVDGQRSDANRAAAAGDVNPEKVIGKILVLTPLNESTTRANGAVTYTYKIQLPSEAEATDAESEFALDWTADPTVITAVDELHSGSAHSVVFYNLEGQCSATPWQGLNIVVKRYGNGTTETSKVLK